MWQQRNNLGKDFENILFSMDAEEYELKHKWFELSGELMNDAKSTFDNLGLTTKEMLHRVDSLIACGHTMMEINEKGIDGFRAANVHSAPFAFMFQIGWWI